MKKINLLLVAAFICLNASAQTDTTISKKSDTMRIGNIIIIKKGKKFDFDSSGNETAQKNAARKHASKVSTNWWIVDLGFSNYDDQTNYAAANASGYLVDKPGSSFTKNDFYSIYIIVDIIFKILNNQ